MSERSGSCRVFISYAHESDEHREQVRDLWIFLRSVGIDAKLDRSAAERRQDWPLWMADQIREADHVLVVASAAYRERAEGRSGSDIGRGVQWEARLIRDAFYANPNGLDRFVPVVLPGQSVEGVPDFLAPASNTVYHVTDFTLAGADALVRLLLDQPAETEPPLRERPVLGQRDHALTPPVQTSLRHEVTLHVGPTDEGCVRTETRLAGTVLGQLTAALPVGLGSWQAELDSPSGASRLTALGQGLWRTLLDEPTGRRLVELIDRGPVGSVVEVVVHLTEELSWLPVELLCLPDGRLAATMTAVRFTCRLAGVDRPATPPLAGPLKILAAVAAPDETKTKSQPLDVEAEMQALLDAITDLDLASVGAQVRILEVASLAEISHALATEQYHVLHLSAHGSAHTVELENEDGHPDTADADELVAALKAGEKRLPLVVLSSCQGAEAGTAGLAAELVRHGADRVVAMQAAVTDRFATALARELYHHLATTPQATVAQSLATARRVVSDNVRRKARRSGVLPRPEFAVPTLLCGGPDLPLRDPALTEVPLKRSTVAASGTGVRELPIGHLIGRRAPVRIAMAVLRGNAVDRERFGDRAGVAVTGIGGIGKTAVAGRILARARDLGWMIAEHVGAWNPAALIRSVADALTDPRVAEMLREPGRDDADKLSLVLMVLQRVRLLVLFDDFEQNLTPTGEFTDPGFAEIFTLLCDAARTGRILVTCRYPVPGSEDALLRIDLPALSSAELSRLFLRLPALRELSTEDRRLVGKTIGGHPRLIEFLDVLLRHGTAASFRHVTTKLRSLATAEHIDLTPSRDVAEGVNELVRLGSRDILLDTLVDQLTPAQLELALQAALARAPFAVPDLAHTRHGTEPDPLQLADAARDVERLRDLTLLSATPDDELEMHPWVAASLERHQTETDLVARHQRGAAMRLHRINDDRGGFHDIVDLIGHFAGCHNYDDAIACALEACDLVGGEVGVSALLAEAVPMIPIDHPRYLVLADRECTALQAIGLATATSHRLHSMLAISEQRAAADPGNAQYQRSLSIRHEKLGNLAVTLGDTTAANEHYHASLAIREPLAAADPGNAQYQRDLSISHNKLGDLAVALGDTTATHEHYHADLAIAQQLAAADPGNAEYQRDLSISHDRLGNLAVTSGDTTAADEHYRISLAIRARLAAADPGNAQYQRDLSVSRSKLGDLAVALGDTTAAHEHYRTSLAIALQLAGVDPRNAQYQRGLSISHNKLGDLAVALGDTTAAHEHYRASLAIREPLAAADPGNAEYQRDLSISHNKLGNLAMASGDTTAAREHYHADLAIAQQLAAADPGNAEYQRDLSISQQLLDNLAEAQQPSPTETTDNG